LPGYFAHEESTVYLGRAIPWCYDAPLGAGIEKVVLLVDESVRGDYLQINNPRFDNTPFLARPARRSRTSGWRRRTRTVRPPRAWRCARVHETGTSPIQWERPAPINRRCGSFANRMPAYRIASLLIDTWLLTHQMHSMLT
jgi:hypothetical protein